MAGLINIGLSGVLAHQSALNTTGNNITNANTPGYSRQQVSFETQPGRATSGGSVGTGVLISNIERLANEYLTEQVRSDSTLQAEQEVLTKELSRLDNLLGGEFTGLSKAINNFFASLQNAAEDPASLPQRQLVMSEAQTLVNRFQALQLELTQQQSIVNARMQESTVDANTLLSSIADLNLAIAKFPGATQGRTPNDLLDQRDEALRQLSEKFQVRVVPTDGGQVNVQLNNGQALVVGGEYATLGTRPSTSDPRQLEFTLNTVGRSTLNVTEQMRGGELGGLLRFQNEALTPAFDQLGVLAVVISDQMNAQHVIGMDLEGDLGGNFFTDVNSEELQRARVLANANNRQPQDAVLGVTITSSRDLVAGTWTLQVTGPDGQYELVDQATGRVVNQGVLPDPLPAEISMPGFNIRVESGSLHQGDRFQIQPTRQSASEIRLQIQREEDLALASPIRSAADNGNGGDAIISQGAMLAVRNPLTNAPLDAFAVQRELSPPLMVRFTSETSYEVLDATDPSRPVPLAPPVTGAYQPGIANKLFSEDPADPNYRGFQFEISGNPVAGDVFSINYNTGGVGDNRNAELMAALATVRTMNGGNQSFTDGYAQLVETVGVKTRQAQLDQDAAKSLLQQSSAQRESVSGVNLDEEAGRLIQYQAAYNASARVMGVAQELFDTLLGTFR